MFLQHPVCHRERSETISTFIEGMAVGGKIPPQQKKQNAVKPRNYLPKTSEILKISEV
jgi:hypothetical protein